MRTAAFRYQRLCNELAQLGVIIFIRFDSSDALR